MAVKIARGTTGQADTSQSPQCVSHVIAPPIEGQWYIGGPSSAYHDEPNGWNITEDGIVTVPNDAELGEHSGIVGGGVCGTDEWGNMNTNYYYEFEVVCMKVTITGLT